MSLPQASKKRRTTTPPSPNPFLLQMGRKRESLVGDGKCYFRTVSNAAFGTEDRHLALRSRIVNFMAELKSIFAMSFCNKDYIKPTLQTYDKKELLQPKLKFRQRQHFFKLTLVYLHKWVKSRRGIHTNRGLR